MSKFKQVSKALLGAMVATSVALCCFAGPALASEVQPRTTIDHPYVFAFGWYGHTGYTADETTLKENATPTYLYAGIMDMPGVHLYIDGWYGSSGWNNKTCGDYAYLTSTGQWWIHNTVYEDNGRNTCLARLRGMGSTAGNLSGQWSPDSWGTYPSLNNPYA